MVYVEGEKRVTCFPEQQNKAKERMIFLVEGGGGGGEKIESIPGSKGEH